MRLEVGQNSGGGIVAADGANVSLVNSMIGALYQMTTAVTLTSSSASIVGSTLVGGYAGRALDCSSPGDVSVHDSILLSPAMTAEIDCDEATIDGSATEAEVGPFDPFDGWFVNPSAGDFHLTPIGAPVFAGVGQWETGDPLVDIDGDPRAGVDGEPDFPGADVP